MTPSTRTPRCGGIRHSDMDGGHEPAELEPRQDESPRVEAYQCPICGAVYLP